MSSRRLHSRLRWTRRVPRIGLGQPRGLVPASRARHRSRGSGDPYAPHGAEAPGRRTSTADRPAGHGSGRRPAVSFIDEGGAAPRSSGSEEHQGAKDARAGGLQARRNPGARRTRPGGMILRAASWPDRSINGTVTGTRESDRARHLVGLQALGAHVEALGRPIDQSANALNIRIPAAVGANVRVRHALAEAGSLTAHVTNGSHDDLLGFQISCDPALTRDARHAMGATAGNCDRVPDRRGLLQVFPRPRTCRIAHMSAVGIRGGAGIMGGGEKKEGP